METSLSADGCDGLDEDCFGWENENIGETVVPEWLKISSVMASSDSYKHLRCTPRENHVQLCCMISTWMRSGHLILPIAVYDRHTGERTGQ